MKYLHVILAVWLAFVALTDTASAYYEPPSHDCCIVVVDTPDPVNAGEPALGDMILAAGLAAPRVHAAHEIEDAPAPQGGIPSHPPHRPPD